MGWIEPELDWSADDSPAPSDFIRIEGDIEYLKDAIDAEIVNRGEAVSQEAEARAAAVSAEAASRTAAILAARCLGSFYGSKTRGELFATLAPFVPNTSDVIPLSGCIRYYVAELGWMTMIITRAVRMSSTRVSLYGTFVEVESNFYISFASILLDQGDPFILNYVSLAW